MLWAILSIIISVLLPFVIIGAGWKFIGRKLSPAFVIVTLLTLFVLWWFNISIVGELRALF